jgi:hypothetical protein
MGLRSGITRPFDLAYPSNRFVLLATPGIGVVAGVVTLIAGEGWAAAFHNGFAAGGAAFLAWALTRELHPDRTGSAAVAALLAPAGIVLADPDLLAAAVVLLGCRVVAGTTGRVLRWFDVGLVAAVAAPVAFRASGPGVLTCTAAALGIVLIRQDRRRLELGSAVVVLVGLAVWSWWQFTLAFDPDPWSAVAAGAGLVALAGPVRVSAATDRPGGTVTPMRVRLGRAYAWVAAAGAALALAPAAMAPLWVALAVTGARPR